MNQMAVKDISDGSGSKWGLFTEPAKALHGNRGDEGLWTEREAAQFLRLSPRKVFTLAKEGQLQRVKIGNSVRYDPADVRTFIETCKLAT